MVTLGETSRQKYEGEFESLKAIYAVSPTFVPKLFAWRKFTDNETYFFSLSFVMSANGYVLHLPQSLFVSSHLAQRIVELGCTLMGKAKSERHCMEGRLLSEIFVKLLSQICNLHGQLESAKAQIE